MSYNLHRFETLLQLSRDYLQQVVDADRENVQAQLQRTIVLEPQPLGDFQVEFGTLNIVEGSVQVSLDSETEEALLGLTPVQVDLNVVVQSGTPEESRYLYSLAANVEIRGGVDEITLGGGATRIGVGLVTKDLTLDQVSVNIVTGHPLDDHGLLEFLIRDRIRLILAEMENPTPPANADFGGVFSANFSVEILNDLGGDEADQIRPIVAGDQIELNVPVVIRWSQIESDLDLASPMGVQAQLSLTAPFSGPSQDPQGVIAARFKSSGEVMVDQIQPVDGIAGENYVQNQQQFPIQELVNFALLQIGQTFLKNLGDMMVDVGTVVDIETLVRLRLHQELTTADALPLWTRPMDEGFQALAIRILPDTLAVGVNPLNGAGSQDLALIPRKAEHEFSSGTNANVFIQELNDFLKRPKDADPPGILPIVESLADTKTKVLTTTTSYVEALNDGEVPEGLRNELADHGSVLSSHVEVGQNEGNVWLLTDSGTDEHTYEIVEEDDELVVYLTFDQEEDVHLEIYSLAASLADGYVELKGAASIHRPGKVIGEIKCTFEAKITLEWVDVDDGQQLLVILKGKPKVDIKSTLLKVVSFVLGVLLAGSGAALLSRAIAGVVSLFVIDAIVNAVGGRLAGDNFEGFQIEPLGDVLDRVGPVKSKFVNPIKLFESGVVFFGEATVSSFSASAVDPHANGAGPYEAAAAEPFDFAGGPANAPSTQFHWAFGDGQNGQGASASHAYNAPGIYVPRLNSSSAQYPDDAVLETIDLAAVFVRNVTPTVTVSGDSLIREGDPLELTLEIEDLVPNQAHRAFVDWGDDNLPEEVDIAVTHEEPSWKGVAYATHTYCRYGSYEVRVYVVDEHGGRGADQHHVVVQNVAPFVDAGDHLFAYPCVPLRLEAKFCDPGWCSKHTAIWDFGDCTPPQPASVFEIHEPPAATGLAVATHTYECCGSFRAEVTVTDDGGKSTSDTVVVRKVDLRNGQFEEGFRRIDTGRVANRWQAYYLAGRQGPSKPPSEVFHCEQCVVHCGRRSQRISALGGARAGLFQAIGANSGWDYQVVAWFHIEEPARGTIRLGLDPTGGTDVDANTVIWTESQQVGDWYQLVQRVTAEGDKRRITIFLEADGLLGGSAYFDEVTLHPYPCALDTDLEFETVDVTTCIDWAELTQPIALGAKDVRDGFVFSTEAERDLRTTSHGPPVGQGKLSLPADGEVWVQLPKPAQKVAAEVVVPLNPPLEMLAFSAEGEIVGKIEAAANAGEFQTLLIEADGIVRLRFQGGKRATLVRLCSTSRKRMGCRSDAPLDPIPQ